MLNRSISVFLFLVCIISSDAFAQAKLWLDKGQPVCTESGWQRNPRLCTDGARGAIIAWEDLRGSSADIYAQRMSVAGAQMWDANGVAVCTAAGTQSIAGVMSDGNGGAILVWSDKRGSDYDLYAQRVDATGVVQWQSNGVAVCSAAKDQTLAKVISDNAGGVFIVWQDKRGASIDVYAQRVSPSGAMLWTADGVAVCTEAGDQSFPEITSDGDGGCIIIWSDKRIEEDVYAQRLSPTGDKLWNASGAVVTAETGRQFAAKVAENGTGGACIVWQDLRSGSTTDIYYQLLDKNGNRKFATTTEALAKSPQAQTGLNILADGIGGSIVIWTDYRGDITTGDIYVRRVSEKGELQWTPFTGSGLPICDYADAQDNAVLINDGAGGAFAVWQDRRTTFDYDLYMNRIDAQGKTSFAGWQANGTMLVADDHNQYGPQIVPSGHGAAIIAWYDGRVQDGVADIYAQRVSFAPWIVLNKTSLDFGAIKIKDVATRTMTIRNEGALPLTISTLRVVKIDLTDRSLAERDFTLKGAPQTPFTLPIGDSLVVTIEFKTDSASLRLARLQILHDAPGSTNYIMLSGTGTDPKISVSPTQCSIGIVKVKSQRDTTLTGWITNPGNGILSITNIELDGTNKDQFELIGLPSFPHAVSAGGSLNVRVRFKPVVDGSKSAKIKITNNASATPKEISLSGSGAYASFEYTPFALNWDTVGIGAFRGKVFSIINSGPVPLSLVSLSIGGTDTADFRITYYYPHTIAVADTYGVWINFEPKKLRERRATLKIVTDALNTTETVQMKGIGGVLNSIDDEIQPNSIVLRQNYPNPFRDETMIETMLSEEKRRDATLIVYDLLGRRVLDLTPDVRASGIVHVRSESIPHSGVYRYVLTTESRAESRSMILQDR